MGMALGLGMALGMALDMAMKHGTRHDQPTSRGLAVQHKYKVGTSWDQVSSKMDPYVALVV